jgi:predicted transcriptional regulator
LRLRDIARLLKAEVLGGHLRLDMEISQALGSDIMSSVLSTPCGDNAVLLTGLTNLQVVRTAEMVDVKAIIFVKGRCPRSEAIRLARELDLPVLLTNYSLAETCALLSEAGIQV